MVERFLGPKDWTSRQGGERVLGLEGVTSPPRSTPGCVAHRDLWPWCWQKGSSPVRSSQATNQRSIRKLVQPAPWASLTGVWMRHASRSSVEHSAFSSMIFSRQVKKWRWGRSLQHIYPHAEPFASIRLRTIAQPYSVAMLKIFATNAGSEIIQKYNIRHWYNWWVGTGLTFCKVSVTAGVEVIKVAGDMHGGWCGQLISTIA